MLRRRLLSRPRVVSRWQPLPSVQLAVIPRLRLRFVIGERHPSCITHTCKLRSPTRILVLECHVRQLTIIVILQWQQLGRRGCATYAQHAAHSVRERRDRPDVGHVCHWPCIRADDGLQKGVTIVTSGLALASTGSNDQEREGDHPACSGRAGDRPAGQAGAYVWSIHDAVLGSVTTAMKRFSPRPDSHYNEGQ